MARNAQVKLPTFRNEAEAYRAASWVECGSLHTPQNRHSKAGYSVLLACLPDVALHFLCEFKESSPAFYQ